MSQPTSSCDCAPKPCCNAQQMDRRNFVHSLAALGASATLPHPVTAKPWQSARSGRPKQWALPVGAEVEIDATKGPIAMHAPAVE